MGTKDTYMGFAPKYAGKRTMKIILETQRLTLREMTQEDYPALAAILRDGQTMCAYEGAFSEAETQAWLDKNIARYRDDGIGLWAVILKDSGLMIGQAGLTWQDVNGRRVPEVGYLFNRAYWGRGCATEAAIACKEYGFSRLGFDEIYSIVRDTNIASINVQYETVCSSASGLLSITEASICRITRLP